MPFLDEYDIFGWMCQFLCYEDYNATSDSIWTHCKVPNHYDMRLFLVNEITNWLLAMANLTKLLSYLKTISAFLRKVPCITVYCMCINKLIKVSRFHKQIFLFSFEPKNKWNNVLNSALASKMSQIKKMNALYYTT